MEDRKSGSDDVNLKEMEKLEKMFKLAARNLSSIFKDAGTFFESNEFDGGEELMKKHQEVNTMMEGEMSAYFPVYGTVKAGKSTFLNFVFQEELLPARPQPMTTLPIRIMHKNGVTSPTLELPKSLLQSLNGAVKKLADTLDKNSDAEVNMTTDMKLQLDKLSKRLKDGTVDFQEKYLDKQTMVNALFDLSDICRFIFFRGETMEDYGIEVELEKLPLITLQMELFKDLPEQKVYFVDTPGPDEARAKKILVKVNKAVLEKSSGTLFIAPALSIANEATQNLMGTIATYQMHKRLIVVLNMIDSIKADDHATEVLKLERQVEALLEFVADKVILPTSGFYLDLLMKAQRWLESTDEPVEKAKFFTHLEKLKVSNRDELKAEIGKLEKEFNANLVKKTMRSLYSNSIKHAISAKIGDIYTVGTFLEEKLEWTQRYLDGDDIAKKKIDEGLAQATQILSRIDDLMSKIRIDVEKEVLELFESLFIKPMEIFMSEQKWRVVDANEQPVPNCTWMNMGLYQAWLKVEPEKKVTTHQAKQFKTLSKQASDGVNRILSTKWLSLRDSIDDLEKIEQFEDQSVLDASVPPHISLPPSMDLLDLPNGGVFDTDLIPHTILPDGRVKIEQETLGPAVAEGIRGMFDPIREALKDVVAIDLAQISQKFVQRVRQFRDQVVMQIEENKKLSAQNAEAIEEMKRFNSSLTERFFRTKKMIELAAKLSGTEVNKTQRAEEKKRDSTEEGNSDASELEGNSDASELEDSSDEEADEKQSTVPHTVEEMIPEGALTAHEIQPGKEICLFGGLHHKAVTMQDHEQGYILHGLDDTRTSLGSLPSHHEEGKFTIVDAGEGRIALYNSHHRRFVKMDGKDAAFQVNGTGGEEQADDLQEDIDKDKQWVLVDAGQGRVAFYNALHGCFLNMSSLVVDGVLRDPDDLPHDRWAECFWAFSV